MMNSIYNDDIAMTNKNNKTTENKTLSTLSAEIIADAINTIARDAGTFIASDERSILLEAAKRLHAYNKASAAHLVSAFHQDQIAKDWQDAALNAAEQRDYNRVTLATREAEIDLLKHRIDRLERCVIQNALSASLRDECVENKSSDDLIFHAGRTVEREIVHERHNDETDIENGEL